MTMAQVAEVVGVHETTVSRAVSGKYIETPQGMFEMKYFFTAGLQTTAGGEGVSNTSVKDMIAEIFKAENTGKPLVRPGSREDARRTKASPSPAAPSPNTATSWASCPRICAGCIDPLPLDDGLFFHASLTDTRSLRGASWLRNSRLISALPASIHSVRVRPC
jgi:hypothetical protein